MKGKRKNGKGMERNYKRTEHVKEMKGGRKTGEEGQGINREPKMLKRWEMEGRRR